MTDKIETIPDILNPEGCDYLIETFRDHLTQARVGLRRILSPGRIANNFKFKQDNELTVALKKLTCDLVGCENSQIEPIELICYPEDGYYALHHDGTNRSHSLTVYLNDDYTGGAIHFPTEGLRCTNIKKGSGLLWKNDPTMVHECERITSGEKWLVSIWVKK